MDVQAWYFGSLAFMVGFFISECRPQYCTGQKLVLISPIHSFQVRARRSGSHLLVFSDHVHYPLVGLDHVSMSGSLYFFWSPCLHNRYLIFSIQYILLAFEPRLVISLVRAEGGEYYATFSMPRDRHSHVMGVPSPAPVRCLSALWQGRSLRWLCFQGGAFSKTTTTT